MHQTLFKAALKAIFITACITFTATPASAQGAPPSGMAPGVLRVYGSVNAAAGMREAALAFGNQRGVFIDVTAGPGQTWKSQAIRDADLIFSDAEYMMNNFVQRDIPDVIDTTSIRTVSLHPPAILVHRGNPAGIRGIKDLAKKGVKIIVVQGDDQAGMWEEAAKRTGGEKLVEDIRRNMAFYAVSIAEAKALWATDKSYTALLIWTAGRKDSSKTTAMVITQAEDESYRACVIAITNRTTQRVLAEEFADFIQSAEGQQIFLKWGGTAP